MSVTFYVDRSNTPKQCTFIESDPDCNFANSNAAWLLEALDQDTTELIGHINAEDMDKFIYALEHFSCNAEYNMVRRACALMHVCNFAKAHNCGIYWA